MPGVDVVLLDSGVLKRLELSLIFFACLLFSLGLRESSLLLNFASVPARPITMQYVQ